MNTPEEYPPPKRPRAHCWVYCERTASRVVSISRTADDPKLYRVSDPDTWAVIFRGPWRDVIDFATGKLAAPFMDEAR